MKNAFHQRVLPVIALPKLEHARPLAQALLAGGLKVMEITLRTPVAKDAIELIRREFPEIYVGAGTVTAAVEVPELKGRGAQFLVSPGLNPRTVEAAAAATLPIYPGVATPSEVEQAMELGLKTLKFFPAEAIGGIPLLKSLLAPYGHLGLSFMPTGGINPGNAPQYLALKGVAAIGGSWFVKPELMEDGRWDEITSLTKAAVELAASARPA